MSAARAVGARVDTRGGYELARAATLIGEPLYYGRWPGLGPETRFEGRDLAVTTDFRALFAEVAERHLGVPASAPLFPGWPRTGASLGLFG